MQTTIFARLATGLATVAVSGLVAAQSYPVPNRPVRIVNPFAPGGSGDVVVRAVTQKISANTNVPFVIEVKSGAGGRIGYEAAVKAPNDGYHLVITDTTYTMLPVLGPSPRWHSPEALAPVAVLAHSPFLIIARTSLGKTTLDAFLQHAKANPGKLNYGSAGNGTINHITTEIFRTASATNFQHVPYRGMTDAVTAILGDQLDLILIGPLPVAAHLASGRLTALAVAGPVRLPKLPTVPTVDEAGLPGYRAGNWFGLTAPRGTPAEALDWLHRETMKALDATDVRERFIEQGLVPGNSSRDEFAKLMLDDGARWAGVVRSGNIKVD